MKLKALAAGILLSALTSALPSVAQQDIVTAQTVVTVVPKSGEAPALPRESLKVWADGKESTVTQWQPLRGDRAGLEFRHPYRRFCPLQHRPPTQRSRKIHPVDAAHRARRCRLHAERTCSFRPKPNQQITRSLRRPSA